MHDTDWINGSYSDAMQMVVERALFSQERGGLVKQGEGIMDSILGNPHMQRAFAGAAIGGGLGGAMPGKDDYGEQNSRIGQGLKGALLGGAVGGGSGILKNYLEAHPPDLQGLVAKAKALFGNTLTGVQELTGNLGTSIKSADMAGAIGQSQDARRELGILGADETKIDPLMSQLRAGKLSPGAAVSGAHKEIPGSWTQLGQVPSAVGTSLQQGDINNAAAQADVVGLKNLNPFGQHFSPLTALGSLGAGAVGATKVAPWLHEKQLAQTTGTIAKMKAKFPTVEHAKPSAAMSKLQRLGPALGLASLPLVAREWFGGHGYRSGAKPIQDLVSANQELAGK